jgi:hypothetical protein
MAIIVIYAQHKELKNKGVKYADVPGKAKR